MNPAKTLVQARLMITFARIVEAGSISAASVQFGVDKASISRQLKELEDMLGVRLLNRTTRQLSVTDVGKIVLERALRVMQEVESAQTEAESFRLTPSGTLTVSASVAFGRAQIVPYVAKFLEAFPEIHIELCLLDRHVHLVDEGMDVLIRLCDQPPEQLVAHLLGPLTYTLVAAPKFLETVPKLVMPKDLEAQHCLFYAYRKNTTNWKFKYGREFCNIEVKSRVAVNSSDAVRMLTLDGLGIALLPTFSVKNDIANGTLVSLLPKYKALGNLGSHVYALHAPGRFIPPKVRSFIQFLRHEWETEKNSLF
jgi:DNA-binding transcriptional LysR family regulator